MLLRLLLTMITIATTMMTHGIAAVRIEGKLNSLSVGPAGVWGVQSNGNLFYRQDTYGNPATDGTAWLQVPGELKQVDVGRDIIWGVNNDYYVFYRTGITAKKPEGTGWVSVEGRLRHVSVSNHGYVWGITPDNYVVVREGADNCHPAGSAWKTVPSTEVGQLTQLSVGDAGVWAINTFDEVFYREGTYGDNGSEGHSWVKMPGQLTHVTSGNGIVVGVHPTFKVYARLGISIRTPVGTTWKQIPGFIKVIEAYDTSAIWGVDSYDDIYHT